MYFCSFLNERNPVTIFLGIISLIGLFFLWLFYKAYCHKKIVSPRRRVLPQKTLFKYQKAINKLKNEESISSEVSSLAINSLNTHPPEALSQFELITPGMIDKEDLGNVEEMIDGIKRPHPVLQAITKEITAEELLDIMHGCPDITAKLLTTVNSAAFGLAQPITSINHAVIYLGMSLVKNIVIQFLVKQNFQQQTVMQRKAYQKLWTASYVTSSLGFLIGQSLSKINAAELSTKALLGNIGCFAIVSYAPRFAEVYLKESSLLVRTQLEQQTYRLNASVVGNFLARKWKLPITMAHAITHGFSPLQYHKKKHAFSQQEKHDLVFCYLVARLGDAIAYGELSDIGAFNVYQQTSLDYFYLLEAMEDTALLPCLNLFHNPTFQKKANKIIKQAVHTR